MCVADGNSLLLTSFGGAGEMHSVVFRVEGQLVSTGWYFLNFSVYIAESTVIPL